jgi:hypothetical protein
MAKSTVLLHKSLVSASNGRSPTIGCCHGARWITFGLSRNPLSSYDFRRFPTSTVRIALMAGTPPAITESDWSTVLFEPTVPVGSSACVSDSGRSPRRPPSSRPQCSRVTRTTEQLDNSAFTSIRTVTKSMLTKRGFASNMLVYKVFHDHKRNRVNRATRMPSPTARRLSQQFRD